MIPLIKNLSQKITLFFINHDIIPQRRKDWCEYALEKRLVTTIAVIFMLAIGTIFFSFYNTAIFLLVFTGIRKTSGGYHAPKNYLCVAGSVILILGGLKIAKLLELLSGSTISILYILAVFTILVLSPVNHPNMDLTSKEIVELKRVIKYKMATISGVLIFLIMCFDNKLCLVVIASVITVGMTVGLAKIIGQEVN